MGSSMTFSIRMAAWGLAERNTKTQIVLLPWVSMDPKTADKNKLDKSFCGMQFELLSRLILAVTRKFVFVFSTFEITLLTISQSVQATIADETEFCKNENCTDVSVAAFEAIAFTLQ